MKKLLIVASADTIFITNYVRALKLEMDVEVHVYSPFPPMGNYTSYPYDYVYFEDNIVFRSRLLNKVSFLLTPFVFRKRLSSFLKQHNCHYDYIHFHRILPSWVLRIDEYKRYAEKVEVLNQSTFITTNSISSEYPEWVQQSIVDRQKQMAKCAKTIWKITF